MKKSLLLSVSLIAALCTSAFATKPAGHPSAASQGLTAQPAAPETLSGKALQTMNSGGYTYIYLQKKNGEKVWVAVPETTVKTGSQISFKPGIEMRKFESKSLKRKFDSIIFSDGVQGAGTASAAPAAMNAMDKAPGSMSRTTTSKENKISVSKATGANATTIEGAYGNSAKLDKQKVVIRGKVVKVSAGIMGKNWVHIQDGTGSQAKGNYDLTCTTAGDLPNVGDVVTISGTLTKDKDFGAGYFYKVIIENSTVKK